jgi:transcription initiation factor IIE alpha subunit
VSDIIFMCGECGWPYKQAGAREAGAAAWNEKCEKCGGGLLGSKESPVIWIQYFCLQRVDVQEIDAHGGPFGKDALKRGWHA